jgi:ABC-2 type transport system permease protein
MIVLKPNPPLQVDGEPKVIAARIKGKSSGDAKPINVVFIADSDFLTEIATLEAASLSQPLDNVKLVQNAIEVLAGDSDFVRLRNRQSAPRSLTRFEALVEPFRRERLNQQQKIDEEIQTELQKAQQELDTAVKRINEDKELDFAGKLQQLSQDVNVSQRRFDIVHERLERRRQEDNDRIKAEEQQNVATMESKIRSLSVFFAPLPAIVLGLWVLSARFLNERKQIKPTRRV